MTRRRLKMFLLWSLVWGVSLAKLVCMHLGLRLVCKGGLSCRLSDGSDNWAGMPAWLSDYGSVSGYSAWITPSQKRVSVSNEQRAMAQNAWFEYLWTSPLPG